MRINFLTYLVLLFSLILYGFFLYPLLPYGDATIHAFHTNNLINLGWNHVLADYPLFFYYIDAYLQVFFGSSQLNLLIFLGIAFILFYSYFIVRLVTKSALASIIVILVLAPSSKLIFYGFRLYQEVLLTGFFLITLYYFICYLYKDLSYKYFLLLVFFLGISISIKQQGFLILYISFFGIFLYLRFFKQITTKTLCLFVTLPAVFFLPFYGILFHNMGILVAGNHDIPTVRLINYIGQMIFQYNGDKNRVQSLKDVWIIPEKIQPVDPGAILAQERQTTFLKAYTDKERFNEIHTVYTSNQSPTPYRSIQDVISIILIYGFFFCLLYKKNKRTIAIFMVIFLSINYMFFFRNTDQARYHLFIPFFLLLFSGVSIREMISKYRKLTIILVSFFLISTSTVTYNRFLIAQKGALKTQIYSSSVGGVLSVKESGEWLANNVQKDAVILHSCGNELAYYSGLQYIISVPDGSVYFYNIGRLKGYMSSEGIQYVVIFKSQIVSDFSWNNFCRIPEVYFKNIEQSYPRIFTSSSQDVFIYEVKE